MKRRAFLGLMAGLALAAVRVKTVTGESVALKGIHLTTGFDAPVVNLLGANWWCGDDNVLRIIRDTAQQEQFQTLTATYVYRIPHDASVTEIQAVQQLPNFNNEFIVMNEPDLANFSHQYTADRVTEAITNIQDADPTRSNKIFLCAGSQYAGTAYVAGVLNLLPTSIRTQIDGIAIHYYSEADPSGSGLHDENKLRVFLAKMCGWATTAGFSKVWISELGWTEEANPVRVANCLPRWIAVINEFPVVKRWNWYGANVPLYQKLVNGTVLTGVGTSFKSL